MYSRKLTDALHVIVNYCNINGLLKQIQGSY